MTAAVTATHDRYQHRSLRPPTCQRLTRRAGHEEVTTSRRAAQRQRTRDTIEAAALELFATNGYQPTSTSDIAAAVGVTERTFFRHFPTKDAIFFHRSREYFETLAAAIRTHIDPAAPTWDGIRQALHDYASSMEGKIERFDRFLAVLYAEPTLRTRLREHRSLWQEWATETLAVTGHHTNAHFISPLVLALIERGQQVWIAGGRSSPLATAMDQALTDAQNAAPS